MRPLKYEVKRVLRKYYAIATCLTGWTTAKRSLFLRFLLRMDGRWVDVEEAMIVGAFTAASKEVKAFVLISMVSGVHSWTRIAPSTHSSSFVVPVNSFSS